MPAQAAHRREEEAVVVACPRDSNQRLNIAAKGHRPKHCGKGQGNSEKRDKAGGEGVGRASLAKDRPKGVRRCESADNFVKRQRGRLALLCWVGSARSSKLADEVAVAAGEQLCTHSTGQGQAKQGERQAPQLLYRCGTE